MGFASEMTVDRVRRIDYDGRFAAYADDDAAGLVEVQSRVLHAAPSSATWESVGGGKRVVAAVEGAGGRRVEKYFTA